MIFPNLSQEHRDKINLLGVGLSQLGAGQAANLQPAKQMIAQRQQQAQQRKMLEDSGIMSRFTEEERAFIASMPPNAAQTVIAQRIFAPKPAPTKMTTFEGPNGVQYSFNPVTGETNALTGAQETGPGYQVLSAEQVSSMGLEPGTYQQSPDGKISKVGGSLVEVNLTDGGDQLPELPKGFGYLRDANGEPIRDARGMPMAAPISGTPEAFDQNVKLQEIASGAIDAAEQSEQRDDTLLNAGDIITQAASRARAADQERKVRGILGQVAALNPSTQNAEIVRQVDSLKAIGSAESLNEMRRQSPTGGALGNVTERELKLLADKQGALDPASPNFARDLADYERQLLRTVHGREAGDKIFEETRSATTSLSEAPGYLSEVDRDLWEYMDEAGRAAILKEYE